MGSSFIHAANRFGLGASAGWAPAGEPRAWVTAQIKPLAPASGPSLTEIRAALEERRQDPASDAIARLDRSENLAWAERMLAADAPFAERWAIFWANHLTVSRRGVRGWVGHYEREAIRPFVFGRFDALLLSAYRHPAMLVYLDQANSVGPGSPAGRQPQRGLNENLARECLELHTVTRAAGYTQEDVGALARILTGWSVMRANEGEGFQFRRNGHEPGPKRLLGRDFAEGEAGGVEALAFLANHRATWRALATRLARHFIADAPPPVAIAQIEAALRDTGGDLSAAARAVIARPEAWIPLGKIRSGQDYAIAVVRGLGHGITAERARMLVWALDRLGQPLWFAPAPTGWGDMAQDWAAPEQLMRRLDLADDLAERAARARRINPSDLAEAMLGPLARPDTVLAARRAGSVKEALLLLLASPEAQRR